MRILVLETACLPGVAAVAEDHGRISGLKTNHNPRDQVQTLLPLIEETLQEADLSVDEIALIATTRGPGSFTGVRIGLATARGLALSSGVPLSAVTTFQPYAHATRKKFDPYTILVAIDGNRDDLFILAYSPDRKAVFEPRNLSVEQVKGLALPKAPLVLTGNGAKKLAGVFPDTETYVPEVPHYMASLAECAAEAYHHAPDRVDTTPFYIRPPDTSTPKKKTLKT